MPHFLAITLGVLGLIAIILMLVLMFIIAICEPEGKALFQLVEQANYTRDEAQARSAGHEVEVIRTWMIEDDADFHAECKNKDCGWKSRDTRDSGSAWNYGRRHIKEVAAALRKASATAR